MMTNRIEMLLAIPLGVALAVGCGGGGEPEVDGDVDADADGDVDGDVDTDVDTDADTDADGDVDGDAEVDGDGDLPEGSCRGDGDCDEAMGEYCMPPGAPMPCGVGCDAPRECEPAAGCAGELLCEEYVASCCFAGDPLASRCVDPCTDTSCDAGERCAEGGLCEPAPCSDEYVCPPHTSCTEGGRADEHGCERATCTADGDCSTPPGGYCVVGQCHETPGSCELPAA